MNNYYKVRLAFLTLVLLVTVAPVIGQTFEKSISVAGALRPLPTRGVQVKSSYTGNGSVTVKMNGINPEGFYLCGTPVVGFVPVVGWFWDGMWNGIFGESLFPYNALLYQTTSTKSNSGSLHQGTGIDGTVYNTESFFACEQTHYGTGGRIKTNESIYYKRNIRTYNYFKNWALQPFHRVFGYHVPVTIEVTFAGGMNMTHIDKFNLPGIGDITPAELLSSVTYSGDFSNLFSTDPDYVTIAAHRGTWEQAGTAQNSIGAIYATTNVSGVDHIELDIRSTRDFHPILFHDDKPQNLLQGIPSNFTLSTKNRLGYNVTLARNEIGTYDFDWDQIKNYYLYDRFDNATTETVVDLETALQYIVDQNITLPINMDLGIPSFGGQVPQGGEKVDGQKFYEKTFLQMIRLTCEKGLTNQLIFKGKFPWNHPIWTEVRLVLSEFASGGVAPKIAYIPNSTLRR